MPDLEDVDDESKAGAAAEDKEKNDKVEAGDKEGGVVEQL